MEPLTQPGHRDRISADSQGYCRHDRHCALFGQPPVQRLAERGILLIARKRVIVRDLRRLQMIASTHAAKSS
jgi:hypothetical protein